MPAEQLSEVRHQPLLSGRITRIQPLEFNSAQQFQMRGVAVLAVAEHEIALQILIELVRGSDAATDFVPELSGHHRQQQPVQLS